MNVQLPGELEEVTLRDLIIGESVYTVPWAMIADLSGNLLLDGSYAFHPNSWRTSKMKVTKISGGYEVDLRGCPEEKYSRRQPPPGFVPLPVAELIT